MGARSVGPSRKPASGRGSAAGRRPAAGRGPAAGRPAGPDRNGGAEGTARDVPWWGILSAFAAPVLVIGGWTVAAALQPDHFDPVRQTISALAAYGAADRWVMTLALAGLGVCHVTTGLALRPAVWPGRLMLMAGGVATAVVAAIPLPAAGGGSLPHGLAAGIGFTALAIWPACGARRGPFVPASLRPAAAVGATLGLLGLLGWFAAELWTGGGQVGLAERVAAGAESIWPLLVVLDARWHQPRGRCGAWLSTAPALANPVRRSIS
jgi:hypothetical membrane protein